jgi:spermidine synthase
MSEGRALSARIAELDWQATPIGEISLRRRREPALDVDVYEVRLGDDFLMSSLFVVAEEALADLALAELEGTDLDVLVGGLGLGFTARAALADDRVRSLHVVEALPQVISWQDRGLLPQSEALTGDPRCRLVAGDFFALTAAGAAYGPDAPQAFSAVLVDIDHTPSLHLHPSSAPFYAPAGLARVADRLLPGGVFGLWSDAPPDDGFLDALRAVFASVSAHVVPFANHYTGGTSTNTVYLGRRAS